MRRDAREAAAARALAAGADRDVADYRAEMRAHTRGLSALRQTQVEHHAEHKADLAEFKAGVRAGFAPVETRFAEVNAGLRVIVGLLEGAAGRPPEAPIRRRLRRRHRRVSVVGSDRVPQKDLRQPQVGPATMAC